MPQYNVHTMYASMDALLDAAPPALRAWLLTPVEERHEWDQRMVLYPRARISEVGVEFTRGRVATVAIDYEHAEELYAARWGWQRICHEALIQIKALATALKAYERTPEPSVDVTFAFLRAYGDALEAISLLRACSAMLSDALLGVITSQDEAQRKLHAALFQKVAKKLNGPTEKLEYALSSAESAVPRARMARWYAALKLGTVPPYVHKQIQELRATLSEATHGYHYYTDLRPKNLTASVRSLEKALEGTQALWDDFLKALDPEEKGLQGLRLPFGRPPYKGSDALRNRRKLSIEGFDLTYNGEIDVSDVIVQQIRDRMLPVLTQYRRQAQRYFPTLVREFTPHLDVWFYNAFGAKTPWGHHYGSGRGIAIYPRNMPWFTAGTPTQKQRDQVVQVIAHEAGHHIWKRVLTDRHREAWTALVTQKAPIDYDAILAEFDADVPAWPPPAPNAAYGWTELPYVENVDLEALYGDTLPRVRDNWASDMRLASHVYYTGEDRSEPIERAAARMSARRDYYAAHGYEMSAVYYMDDPFYRVRRMAYYVRKEGRPAPRAMRWDQMDRNFRASQTRDPTVNDILPRIKERNPTLAIQIAIASSIYDPDYARKNNATSWRYMDPAAGDPRPLFWFTRAEIAALRDKQEQRNVPVFPITGYAATNPEEAWCDAFGNLMAYGPMAVLEPVRELIYRFFPQIRRNPAEDVDADT